MVDRRAAGAAWRSVVDVSYIGSATRKIGVNRPINNLSREQIALGDAFLNALVPNPFVGLMPDGGARNTAATIQRRELLRPYPQFGRINERLVPIGTRDYQAIQVSWDKRLSQGVQLPGQLHRLAQRRARPASLNQGEAPLRGSHRYAPAARPALHRRLAAAGVREPRHADPLRARRLADQRQHVLALRPDRPACRTSSI